MALHSTLGSATSSYGKTSSNLSQHGSEVRVSHRVSNSEPECSSSGNPCTVQEGSLQSALIARLALSLTPHLCTPLPT